jgi:hypothetical protein
VLAYLFPRDAAAFRAQAEEIANSRLWSGVHFRGDDEVGVELGRRVAQAVIEREKADGAHWRLPSRRGGE